MIILVKFSPMEVKVVEAALTLYRQVMRLNGASPSEHYVTGHQKIRDALATIPPNQLMRR